MVANSRPADPSRHTAGGFEILHHHQDRIGGFALSLERAIGTNTWTVELEQPGVLDLIGAEELRDALTEMLKVAAQQGLVVPPPQS